MTSRRIARLAVGAGKPLIGSAEDSSIATGRSSLARDGDRARLAVSNEGPPLPEGSGERLFEPMMSVRPQDGRTPHLGLGLAIVRIVATRHGGEATAANRADGRGVVVTVRLPLASGVQL